MINPLRVPEMSSAVALLGVEYLSEILKSLYLKEVVYEQI